MHTRQRERALGDRWRDWSGISGSTLKLIAVVTMLIDHIAAGVLVRLYLASRNGDILPTYYLMRNIGRIAFPIYCYMIVEGLKYTRNKWKYALRLGVFALVSEIQFDLGFQSKILEFGYQNVYFTLCIGLLTIIGIEYVERKLPEKILGWKPQLSAHIVDILIRLSVLLLSAFGMGAAALCRSDYDWMGVLCIVILYLARGGKALQLGLGYLAFGIFLGEWVAFPAFLLLILYKGKKGFSCKALFYGFYPVHLLALYLVCVLMHIAQYSAL
ncbi:MAG: conjugal transfer protein TraX [Lachnospiraceae bacterium]|nr:conjugal transfer protein TraX [Lachnospiraceae bacterium]